MTWQAWLFAFIAVAAVVSCVGASYQCTQLHHKLEQARGLTRIEVPNGVISVPMMTDEQIVAFKAHWQTAQTEEYPRLLDNGNYLTAPRTYKTGERHL